LAFQQESDPFVDLRRGDEMIIIQDEDDVCRGRS